MTCMTTTVSRPYYVVFSTTIHTARTVRKDGCFSPPVAMGPGVLNSAPYSPCLYTRDFLF